MVIAPAREGAALAGRPLPIEGFDAAVAFASAGLLTSTAARGFFSDAHFVAGAVDPFAQASSIFAFFASSSASTCLAIVLNPPPARPIAARASIAAARTSGSLWSAHLTIAGTRDLCVAATLDLSLFSSAYAAAIQPSVCAGTFGILCPSAAEASSATSATVKQCLVNSSSASRFFATTELFLSLSLSSMPGSTSLASDRNSLRRPLARHPAAAHASPTHAMFASFVTTFLIARATSP